MPSYHALFKVWNPSSDFLGISEIDKISFVLPAMVVVIKEQWNFVIPVVEEL